LPYPTLAYHSSPQFLHPTPSKFTLIAS
jgi:hypothetical protein